MTSDLTRTEFLSLQAAHQHQRRRLRPGDVLQLDRVTELLVLELLGLDGRADQVDRDTWGSTTDGAALVGWVEGDRQKYAKRKLRGLHRLRLIRVGERVDRSARARHRQGLRRTRLGDVLADPGELERRGVVEALGLESSRGEDVAQLGWLDSGRSTRREVMSLRSLELVCEGGCTPASTILLSIKPEFAEAILLGDKTFEFRRALPKREVERVVLYASSPVCRIVGEFAPRRSLSFHPDALWPLTRAGAGIDRSYFDSYFLGRILAHAFEVESVARYDKPVDPSAEVEGFRPPQSYCYLESVAGLEAVLRLARGWP